MPGAPIYGNYYGFVISILADISVSIAFVRYYTKRPFVTDERLALLPLNFFQGARVLDVGCNEGWVTCEIGEYTPFSLCLIDSIKPYEQHSFEVSVSL